MYRRVFPDTAVLKAQHGVPVYTRGYLVCPASLELLYSAICYNSTASQCCTLHRLPRHMRNLLCKPAVTSHASSACADKGRLYLCTSCALHTSSQCWVLWCRRPTRRYQAGCRAWGPVPTPLGAASGVVVATALVDRTSGGIMVATVRAPALCVSDMFWAV